MKTITPILIGLLSCSVPLAAKDRMLKPEITADAKHNKVQIAILLDTSNSMDGLIDQAKTQLWKVVNSFIHAKRDGAAPFVEVALFEYGNDGLPSGGHHIRQVLPLTRDLDEISKQLFALRTNGGEEYCGAVIERALTDLVWDSDPKTYKAIFIAGNEPFTQGPVTPMPVCRNGYSKGVFINTIHCGSRDEGISGSWNDGAELGGGKFMTIDQNRAVSHIIAPQDERIRELGVKLNETYIGYGAQEGENRRKQVKADEDALRNEKAGCATQRSVAKASVNYNNSSWDLVDAVKDKKVDLEQIKREELSAELQSLSPEELKARVEGAAKRRAELQGEIQKLNAEREAYVAEAMKKNAAEGEKTLDQALVEAARDQASSLGYDFE